MIGSNAYSTLSWLLVFPFLGGRWGSICGCFASCFEDLGVSMIDVAFHL